jgi:hypothetical protein
MTQIVGKGRGHFYQQQTVTIPSGLGVGDPTEDKKKAVEQPPSFIGIYQRKNSTAPMGRFCQ